MGAKKRNSESVNEELDNLPETGNDNVNSNPTKKLKKDKKKKVEVAGGHDDNATLGTSAAAPSSMKPMERKKKRKALDKERHHVGQENEGLRLKQSNMTLSVSESRVQAVASSSNGMPAFHIDVFRDLASADFSVREAAVERLVRDLRDVQKAFDMLENKELVEGGLKLEAEKDDGLNNCAPSLRYALRRLIRGVSSSRECARQGFALGLTALIGSIPRINIGALLKLIVDLLEVSSSMKGQEVRDCLLGRLFAYGAIVKSGRLAEDWISDHNSPLIKEFTNILISLAAKKRYLQEPAVVIILELVEKLPTEALVSHVLEAQHLREWFEGAADVGNPDALLLALKIREKVSVDSLMFGNILPYPFSHRRLFSPDHLSSLASCFKESTFCQPRIHSLWSVLVNILIPDTISQDEDIVSASCNLKKHKKSRKCNSFREEISKNIQSFCEAVIEGSLLQSSHDRKHLAFDVLLLLIPSLPASFLPYLMSYKLVQCLMDVLSTKDSWLYKVVQHFLKELLNWVGNDDAKRVALVVYLQKHSNGKFDCITRTKTVKTLLAEFKTESGCMLFIQDLMNLFVDGRQTADEPSDQSQTTDDNSEIGSVEDKDSVGTTGNSDSLKIWIVESLPSILKYLKLNPEAKFRVEKEILKFLAVQGLFSASLGSEVTSFELQEKFRWPKAPTSSAVCRICIEQIQSLLATAQKFEASHLNAGSHDANDVGSYFMRFISTLRNIPSVSLFRPLNDEDEKAFKRLQKTESWLYKMERTLKVALDIHRSHSIRYLLIQILLQLLLQPEEFSEAVSELIILCKKGYQSSGFVEYSDEEELDNDTTSQFIDVLLDTLLSLLPQSSAPIRSAIEQVFKSFVREMTSDGLLRMLRVIKKDLKPARRRGANTENDYDDDDDFLGIEEDEDIDEAESAEMDEGDPEGDAQSDDSEAVELEQVGKELPEGADDSDGGMDDDAMFRMDTYLAQIFKEKKNQAGSETAQSQLVMFKLRVLSLLEIYLHESSGDPQVLTVYSNLTQAFLNPHTTDVSEQLGQRIWGILQKKIFKAKDFPSDESVQLSTLESLLEKSMKLASKPFRRKKSAHTPSMKKQSASLKRQKMIMSLARNSTFWLLKIIDGRRFSESELQRIIDTFKSVLVEYFESKKSQLKAEFLKEIFRRRPWVGHHLLEFLLDKCSSTKSEFRQVEALDLVLEILKTVVSSGSDENSSTTSKGNLESYLQALGHLVMVMATNMPEKQARRVAVRKFCSKIFQMISTNDLNKSFLKHFNPEAQAVCGSQLGEQFVNLKKIE
ncbi:hypothetical protein K2173_009123 [Erythroxylum novogranatense]|uniref:DNA polymerase V n=1 Tax=Erythroxylum novogranatense TaxID=1862640 RepID=A0AAV8TES5_9ROSI|nr:hypothetical protein K2173_009123 [Erythroxylum novogranatense]